MRVEYLSYVIKNNNPVYGGESFTPELAKEKSLKAGDSCNSFYFTIRNHLGTHIDCPAHFFNKGKSIVNYPARSWYFLSPFVLKKKLKKSQLISIKDLEGVPLDADLLLIQSGFSKLRKTRVYSCQNPGFTPRSGMWLRKNRPKIRAVGFDFISLSAYKHRKIGRQAHRVFLDPRGENNPLLIIEDMDLSIDLAGLTAVLAAPILLKGIDSSPCTVIGLFDD